MIEDIIKANTAALTALTAAINNLLAKSAENAAASEVTPAAPAPVNLAPAPVNPAPAPVNPAPAPVNPAPAPVNPAPAPVNPAPVSAQITDISAGPAASGCSDTCLTLEAVRNMCVTAGANGHTQDVVNFLANRHLRRLNELDPSEYPALITFLKKQGAIS